jgi:membrane fusion protein, multidrug efflux system
MRRLPGILAGLLAAVAALWLMRPAPLGDPGGLIALADKTFPVAVALRQQYYPWVEAAAPSATANKSDDKARPGAGSGPGKGKGGGKAGPALVATQVVSTKAIPFTFQGLGTVEAIASIQVRPRLDSQVLELAVAEGALVAKDQLMFKLDERSLRAQLAQSTAQIQKDQAVLDQAGRDLTRADDLLRKKFLTPQSRETASTAVAQAKAQLAVDAAQRDAILTSLSFMDIRAPLAGRIGSIAAKPGAFVRAGDVLATINQIDPIYLTFALPQGRLPELREAMARGTASLRLKDLPDVAGTIAFIENAVDATTGTVQVKGSMPNAAEKLWPGTFANLDLQTGVEESATVVPSAAVLMGQNGPYVFAVVEKKAVLKPLKVARTSGADTVVSEGVSVGDEIVVQGQGNLTDGAEVRQAKDDKGKDGSVKTSAANAGKEG